MKHSIAILLAGGLSSRMNSSKADLRIKGKTQTQRILEILHPLVDQVIIMLAADQKIPHISAGLQKMITIGRDSKKANGPLQGISDAVPLLHHSSDTVYLLTCDLPYLNQGWLLELSKNLKGNIEGVCTFSGGHKNALLACYKKKVLTSAYKHLEKGKQRPVSLWEGFNIKFIQPSAKHQKSCLDMNTRTEYHKAKEFYRN